MEETARNLGHSAYGLGLRLPHNTGMKILLFFQDASLYTPVVEEIGPDHFVEKVKSGYNLIYAVALCTPHLLVAQEPASEDMELFEELEEAFPALSICLLADVSIGTKWRSKLRKFLHRPLSREIPRAYAEDYRVVWLDESIVPYAKGKLKRPEQKPGWEQECSGQEGRFLLQLEGGQRNQAAAEAYLRCLLAQQTGLDQELAYRLAHGSFKALSWSRDLAVRWLALLAHYSPDAELEYLPKPAAASAHVDFVHHEIRPEGVYAATLVLLSQVDPAVEAAIMSLVTSSFSGQHDEALLCESLRLYGLAKFLQEVGTAQVMLMRGWLDPSNHHVQSDGRFQQRQLRLFRDFWRLPFIAVTPEPLASILRGFHAGTTYIAKRGHLPTFLELIRLREDATVKRIKPVLAEGTLDAGGAAGTETS